MTLFIRKIWSYISPYVTPALLILLITFGTASYFLTEENAKLKSELVILQQQKDSEKERGLKIDSSCTERTTFVRKKQADLDKAIEVVHEVARKEVSNAEETNVLNMELPDEIIEILDPDYISPSD